MNFLLFCGPSRTAGDQSAGRQEASPVTEGERATRGAASRQVRRKERASPLTDRRGRRGSQAIGLAEDRGGEKVWDRKPDVNAESQALSKKCAVSPVRSTDWWWINSACARGSSGI